MGVIRGGLGDGSLDWMKEIAPRESVADRWRRAKEQEQTADAEPQKEETMPRWEDASFVFLEVMEECNFDSKGALYEEVGDRMEVSPQSAGVYLSQARRHSSSKEFETAWAAFEARCAHAELAAESGDSRIDPDIPGEARQNLADESLSDEVEKEETEKTAPRPELEPAKFIGAGMADEGEKVDLHQRILARLSAGSPLLVEELAYRIVDFSVNDIAECLIQMEAVGEVRRLRTSPEGPWKAAGELYEFVQAKNPFEASGREELAGRRVEGPYIPHQPDPEGEEAKHELSLPGFDTDLISSSELVKFLEDNRAMLVEALRKREMILKVRVNRASEELGHVQQRLAELRPLDREKTWAERILDLIRRAA